MTHEQLFLLRWLGPITAGTVLAVVGFVARWVERKRFPDKILTVLTLSLISITAWLWWRVLGV